MYEGLNDFFFSVGSRQSHGRPEQVAQRDQGPLDLLTSRSARGHWRLRTPALVSATVQQCQVVE